VAYPVRQQWGLVWTALEEPIGEPPQLPWFDPDRWRWGHGEPFELPVSFGVMIENFRDLAHLAFVHRRTLGLVPEVVDRFAVRMNRKMQVGDGGDPIWGSLRELRFHIVAPNFTSALMLMNQGQRCLLHAGKFSLEEAIRAEERLYREDSEVISMVKPPELPLDPAADVSTVADRLTLAYRHGFVDFVREALQSAAPDSSPMS
jgi:hypothetical protein